MPDRTPSEPSTDTEAVGPPRGMRSIWSGTISFGLVSIPVDLFAGTRGRRARLRMLRSDGTPLRREYYCPKEDVSVPSDALVRGYEVEPGHFVLVSDDELEAAAPEKSRDIDLTHFVQREDIDPMFLDRTYYLLPAAESTKAYRLLAETMQRTQRAGIATFVMRGRAYVIAIFAEQGVLQGETLRFAEEVRDPQRVGLPEALTAEPNDVARFEQHIGDLSADELPFEDLEDRYTQRLLALVEEKHARNQDLVRIPEAQATEAEDGADATVIDLMRLLEERLGSTAAEEAPHAR